MWVQRARIGTPEIKNVEIFTKEWAAWWQDINPAWRKMSLPMEKKDGPWAFMDLPGPNGFLNVLICLKWWRERLQEDSEEWKEAVNNVMWVLERMNGYVIKICRSYTDRKLAQVICDIHSMNLDLRNLCEWCSHN
jgi:hypothetical protein